MGVYVLQFQSIFGSFWKINLDPRTKSNNFELNSLAGNRSQIRQFRIINSYFEAEVNKTEQVNYLFMNINATSFVVSPLRLGVSCES